MNKSLTPEQFKIIMNETWRHHRFGGLSKERKKVYRGIKYVEPIFDMRDGGCWYIKFREHSDKVFDSRAETRPLFDLIMEWLNGEDRSE